jgi:mannose-6-phosphate isomerase-like protein (cupin superfamily)
MVARTYAGHRDANVVAVPLTAQNRGRSEGRSTSKGLLDDPVYIRRAGMGTGTRNQYVAALSASVSTAQFAQFLSHVAAPRQNEPLDVAERLSLVSEHWSPKVVARLNNYEIKVVKLKGGFVWHTHEDTDELFLVVDGKLTIQLREGSVDLKQGHLFVVPKGVEHCPVAEGEVHVRLLEPVGVVNTGDAGGSLTAAYDDSLS